MLRADESCRVRPASGTPVMQASLHALSSERRTEPRFRSDEAGRITVDEHTEIACLVHDFSLSGVKITLPDANLVPSTFLLAAPPLDGVKVCSIVWRTDEMIGAQFR
ncbi:PilZ domain-containing protein [Methylobacterium sp. M6A4_1b]